MVAYSWQMSNFATPENLVLSESIGNGEQDRNRLRKDIEVLISGTES